MRIWVAILVGAAVLATAVVSVRLHIHVAQLRYRVWGLEVSRQRSERELRLARAELEAAKAPRRLLERWTEMKAAAVATAMPALPGTQPPPPADSPPAEDLPPEPPSFAADPAPAPTTEPIFAPDAPDGPDEPQGAPVEGGR